MVFDLLAISDVLQHDIDKAAEVLKAAGCNECYVFGSVANGNEHDNSDFQELELKWFDYVNWYNNVRIHGSLGYLTPVEYQELHSQKCR